MLLVCLCALPWIGSAAAPFDEALVRGYAYGLWGAHDEAREAYRRFVQHQPNSAVGWNNLGNANFRKGRHDEAVSAYRKALQLDPSLAVVHYNLANLQSVEDAEASRRSYAQALALKPGLLEAVSNLVVLEWKLDEDMERRAALLKRLEGAAHSASLDAIDDAVRGALYFNLARLLYQQRFDELQAECVEVEGPTSQRSPQEGGSGPGLVVGDGWDRSDGSPIAHWAGEIAACGDDIDCKKTAVAEWRATLQAAAPNRPTPEQSAPKQLSGAGARVPIARDWKPDPNAFIALRDHCLREHADSFARVIDAYREALEATPHAPHILNNLGVVHAELGRFDQATARLREGLQSDPYAIYLHNNLGVVFYLRGDVQRGEQQYRKVAELRRFMRPLDSQDRPRGMHLVSGVKFGRVAEQGPASVETLRMSRMISAFLPPGAQHRVDIALLWSDLYRFGQIDLMPASAEAFRRAMNYRLLPTDLFDSEGADLRRPVVRIQAELDPVGDSKQIGTGFIVGRDDQRGLLIATAYHNLYDKKLSKIKGEAEATQIQVQFFTPEPIARRGRIVWKDLESDTSDLALVRVAEVPSSMPVVSLAASSSHIAGIPVSVIGHPGLDGLWAISSGHLVETGEERDTLSFPQEGTAPVQGFSGGPVYAADKVIGLYVESIGSQRRGAIPVEKIRDALADYYRRLDRP